MTCFQFAYTRFSISQSLTLSRHFIYCEEEHFDSHLFGEQLLTQVLQKHAYTYRYWCKL